MLLYKKIVAHDFRYDPRILRLLKVFFFNLNKDEKSLYSMTGSLIRSAGCHNLLSEDVYRKCFSKHLTDAELTVILCR